MIVSNAPKTPSSYQTQPTSQARQIQRSVKFAGALNPLQPGRARKLLESLDFVSVGAAPVRQVGVVFSSLIIWRLLAANERRRASVSKRWNELRENFLRDLLGFGFWFLGVPVLQRVYLARVTRKNPHLKDVLIRHEQDTTKNAKGVLGCLKANNPLSNRYIPSSQQVKDQMHQALGSLQKAGLASTDSAYTETQTAYQNLIKHRNFATALGLGSTILLLGVGINLLNFWLTKRNVSQPGQPQTPIVSPVHPQPPAQPQLPTSGQPMIQNLAVPSTLPNTPYRAMPAGQAPMATPFNAPMLLPYATVGSNPFARPVPAIR